MTALEKRLQKLLQPARSGHRLRFLEPISSAQGREIRIHGKTLINFCSNDYLGLCNHPSVRDAVTQSIPRYGVGSGASALLSGRSELHETLENNLLAYTGHDRCLLYSSGYLANTGTISALIHRHDHVFQDRLNHASLIDGVASTRCKTTRYPHSDADALTTSLHKSLLPTKWIVTDTVFSMDGDIAPLPEIATVAAEYDATLVGDDAHGFGVIGNGRGALAEFGLPVSAIPVHIITFGKALGTAGAAVFGSDDLITALIQKSRTFIYDTAPPPIIAAATIAALRLLEEDPTLRTRLTENIDYFRASAATLPLMPSRTPIQPIVIADDRATVKLSEELRKEGLYVRAVRPPTVPAGTSRLRVCITAAHSKADIDRLLNALRTHYRPH